MADMAARSPSLNAIGHFQPPPADFFSPAVPGSNTVGNKRTCSYMPSSAHRAHLQQCARESFDGQRVGSKHHYHLLMYASIEIADGP